MKKKMFGGAVKPIFQRARELRAHQTFAENILWGYLKTKPNGFKFRRQHPYNFYILDFYCHSARIAIEVDGAIHEKKDVQANDVVRQQNLESDGLLVIRFKNNQIEHNLESVIEIIDQKLLSIKTAFASEKIDDFSIKINETTSMHENIRLSPSGVGGVCGMIFCAGLGTRFKPWTDHHPKALAVINGKSLLQRNVENLQQYGIKRVIVNVHHFADQIIEAIKKNDGWGSEIMISDERDAVLETGGGLLKAKPLFTPGQKFITCNADILTDLNINKLLAYHEAQKPIISMAISDRNTSRYMLFEEDDTLAGWRNIATGEERISRAINPLLQRSYDGVVVFEYEVFNHIPFTGKFSLIDLYLHLAKTQTIKGYLHNAERWVDVGRPESVVVAERMFSR